jgi:hypothetical protein
MQSSQPLATQTCRFVCIFAAIFLISATAMAQARQYANWSTIVNGSNLGNGSVRKTSTGSWDFSAAAT